MKKYLAVVLLVLVSTATFAAAQVSPTSVIADVPFAFFVGTKSFPAGMYQFKPSDSLGEITVNEMKGTGSALAAVTTRLSPRSETDAMVVFDVAGTNHYLSEIYVPGLDGFQVKGAPGKHTHMSVKGKK